MESAIREPISHVFKKLRLRIAKRPMSWSLCPRPSNFKFYFSQKAQENGDAEHTAMAARHYATERCRPPRPCASRAPLALIGPFKFMGNQGANPSPPLTVSLSPTSAHVRRSHKRIHTRNPHSPPRGTYSSFVAYVLLLWWTLSYTRHSLNSHAGRRELKCAIAMAALLHSTAAVLSLPPPQTITRLLLCTRENLAKIKYLSVIISSCTNHNHHCPP